MRRILNLVLVLSMTVICLLGTTVRATAAPQAHARVVSIGIFDGCKDYPGRQEPNRAMTWAPHYSAHYDGDPFKDKKKTPPQLVYGYGTRATQYDNGCKPGSGVLPSVGTGFNNMLGQYIPNSATSLSYAAMRHIVKPDFLGPLDKPVEQATKSVTRGLWTPWLVVSLLLVACIALWRGRTGDVSSVVTGGSWALLVLVGVTWTTSYPTEAPRLVDETVSGTVSAVANAFDDPAGRAASGAGEKAVAPAIPPIDKEGGGESSAVTAVDRMYGNIWWNTTYRNWAESMFGDADGYAAKKYGPEIYKLTHMTFKEQDTLSGLWGTEEYKKELTKILFSNKARFNALAQEIKDKDPAAYQYFTGNQWMERTTSGVTSFILVFSIIFFLFFASAGMLIGYLAIRMVIPYTPAAGLVLLFDRLREMLMRAMQQIAQILFAGPVFLVGSLVVLRMNTGVAAIPDKDIPMVLKFILMFLISYCAWKITKPMAFLPGRGASKKMGGILRTAAGVKLGMGGKGKGSDDEPSDEKPNSKPKSKPERDSRPVYQDELPPPRPSFGQLPAGHGQESVHDEPIELHQAPSEPSPRPGIFLPRGGDKPTPRQMNARQQRALTGTKQRPNGTHQGGPNATEHTSSRAPFTSTPPAYDDDRPIELPEHPSDEPVGTSPAPPRRSISAKTMNRDAISPTSGNVEHGAHAARSDRVAHIRQDAYPLVYDAETDPGMAAGSSNGEPIEPTALMVPADQTDLSDIDERNLTYGDDGEPRFVVYSPTASEQETYRVPTDE